MRFILLVIKADGTENLESVAVSRYVCDCILPLRSVVLQFHVQKSHVQIHGERPSIVIEDFCGFVLSHQANVGILLHIKP